MATAPNTVVKTYTSDFVLDQSKLYRIISISEEKFSGSNKNFHSTYKAILSDGRNITTSDINNVFSLDNTVKNPIIELIVRTGNDKEHCVMSYRNEKSDNIYLLVSSTEQKFSAEVFAQIEEQIERTFTGSLVHKMFSDYMLMRLPLIGGSSPRLRPSAKARHTRRGYAFAYCVHFATRTPSSGSA